MTSMRAPVSRAELISDAEEGGFEDLKLPEKGLWSFFKLLGPGMILMMTGVGTSHLVTAPVAGGRFQYALLWCVLVSYAFKYYGFEMAFRFTNATGRSMLDAYATAWKKWTLWYTLIATLLQCVVGQAGRIAATAAVLYFFAMEYLRVDVPLGFWGLLVGVSAVMIILGGRYSAVEIASKVAAGLLLACSIAIYLVEPAPLSSLRHFFVFETPEGSWLVIAAFLGLLPTGIDVSLQASEWGKAKNVGMGRIRTRLVADGIVRPFDAFESKKEDLTVDTSKLPPLALEYCRRWFRIGEWDFIIGHVVSFLIACIFLLLAAVWMYPSTVQGNAVMGEIAKIFTLSVGPWMMVVFLVGAFAATYSTAFNYFDGWPRVVAACCRNLFRSTASLRGIAPEELTPEHRRRWYSEYNIYRLTMFFSLVASVSILAGVSRPVWLVLMASALAFFISPVVYYLNLYYCFTVIPKEDKKFYPSPFATVFSWLSLAVFTGMTAVLVLARIFQIRLF
jgi:Mn2+/Fe2+ NRAMP family transporter